MTPGCGAARSTAAVEEASRYREAGLDPMIMNLPRCAPSSILGPLAIQLASVA